MSEPDGLLLIFLGFVAGYLLCGWEFDRKLAELDRALRKLERDASR